MGWAGVWVMPSNDARCAAPRCGLTLIISRDAVVLPVCRATVRGRLRVVGTEPTE